MHITEVRHDGGTRYAPGRIFWAERVSRLVSLTLPPRWTLSMRLPPSTASCFER